MPEILAIDTHSHINTDTPFDNEESDAYCAHWDYLAQVNSAAGVELTFVSSFAAVKDPPSILDENARLAELCQSERRLRQWVVVDPRIEDTLRQARALLGSPHCVGIKLHPPYHGYSVLEYGEPVFSLAAELGVPVLIHPEACATHILPFADKYPTATFIMAHLSGSSEDHIAAIERAKNSNVYTDVATVSSIKNRGLENAVSLVGSERILFGTDTYAAGFIRGRVEYALISELDKQNILRNNAARLFADKIKIS